MAWRAVRSVGVAMTALMAASCIGGPDSWLEGDEPEYSGFSASRIPLTIYLSEQQTNIRKIDAAPPSEDRRGGVPADQQGVFHLDGKSIGERTLLILAGKLHRFDGVVEEHLMVVQPRYFSKAAGAANPDGFLQVDLKASDRIHVYARNGWPLGTMAGVFRGQIVATDRITLHGGLARDLESYYIAPAAYGQRSPNVIGNVELQIRPNVFLSVLRPQGDGAWPGNGACQGRDVVDATLSGTRLVVKARVDGFPAGRPVFVEVHYRRPRATATGNAGRLWDYVIDFADGLWNASDVEETVDTMMLPDPAAQSTVWMPDILTLRPPLGEDMYPMEIEIRAYNQLGLGPSAQSLSHRLLVVEPSRQVVVDHFELCPTNDLPCHELRDSQSPMNVVARRNVIEWMADRQGLYQTITRPLSRCAGGSSVSGSFTNDCTAYQESSDSELSYRVSSELNFELSVDGQAKGSQSWGGALPGIGDADLSAAIKATFNLQADLRASFETSRTWIDKHSLTVIYDPTRTQLQWWRVATPRLRYIEIAEFDACGVRSNSHDIFLSDLTDSRLVLACEEVPHYDTVCYAVEPTIETEAACGQRLIDPLSQRGRECLAQQNSDQ